MKKSKVLKKLREGKTALCLKMNLSDARAFEIAAMSGFDCLWTCMEHVPNDLSAIERQVLACKAHDTDLVVRVKRGSYSDYIHPLEMDASGIMVPHIMSAEDAKKVVRFTRFHPIGLRPLDGGNADGEYTRTPLNEYMEQANSERFVIVQIEDPEPLDELDDICKIEGIDIIFFGPADFSHALGIPGRFNDPRISEARRRIAEMARKHGKFAGTVGSTGNFEELVEMGYRFVSLGADVVALNNYCTDIISKINNTESKKAKMYK